MNLWMVGMKYFVMSKSFDLYKRTMEEALEAQKKANDATISNLNDKVATLQKENEALRSQVNQLPKTI